ncbi:MAG: TetR/AcrR family transcriptional regulator [Firmicutes bacterium]|nr:TetR/AcrR family transcriptional regulator [Bacillota bacterium]
MPDNNHYGQTNSGGDEDAGKKTYLTRQDVLKAAAGLIRIHGYHGTSTQMIADALGVSKSTFFHHIKSKQDMLFQILQEPLERVYPDLQEIYARQLPPLQKLEAAVTNHILSLAENIEVVTVLLQERDCLKPPYREILEPVRDGYVRIFRLIISDGVNSGAFRPVDPKMAALAILGMCNWLVQWYNPAGEVSIQAIAAMYADFALRLVRP